jgi:hypothetical protein
MPDLATHEREALRHWMRDCTEVIADGSPYAYKAPAPGVVDSAHGSTRGSPGRQVDE